MDPYLAFFLVGCGGLVFMAALGAVGGHGHHHASTGHGHDAGGFHLHGTGAHGHAHADVGFHHAPVSHAGASNGHAATAHHGHHSHSHSPGHAHSSNFDLRAAIMGWLSPRVLLTLSMGAGATGVILAHVVPGEPLRALASLAGGVALEKIVVAPLWNVLTRFASKPARTLDSAVMEEATALANFDAQGFGLVAINLDGHEMRLLARLSPEHRDGRVRSGDVLLVESVDGAKGQCIVSPLSKMLL